MKFDIDKIFIAAADVFSVPLGEIRTRARNREVSDARKAIVYLLVRYLKMKSEEIALKIKRDPQQVNYLLREAEILYGSNSGGFRNKVSRIESMIGVSKCCSECGRPLQENPFLTVPSKQK